MEHCTSYQEATLLLRFLTFSYARLLSINGAAPAVYEPHPQSFDGQQDVQHVLLQGS